MGHLLNSTTGLPFIPSDSMPVSAALRVCVGRQTIAVTTGAVSTLTVPAGAVGAEIQADGGAISITRDGSAPTATIGTRLDDGMLLNTDTVLSGIKMIARVAACNVQVAYFNKI